MRGVLSARFAAALVLAAALPTLAVAAIETRALQFPKGGSSATVKGTLKGDKTVDYTVRARAGQTMRVALKSNNGSNYFNVLPPGSNDAAIFIGSTEGNEWSGTLAADGEYKIRVYLMRNAARRGETATYTLTVAIDGAAKTGAEANEANGTFRASKESDLFRTQIGNERYEIPEAAITGG